MQETGLSAAVPANLAQIAVAELAGASVRYADSIRLFVDRLVVLPPESRVSKVPDHRKLL